MRVRAPLLLLFAALGGCTVGPDYAGPPPVTPASRFARGGDAAGAAAPAVARWWTTLGDPTLDALIDRALARSPTLAVAEARLRQARASLRVEKANAYPNADASALYAHASIPGLDFTDGRGGNASDGTSDLDTSSNRTTRVDLYNLGFDASWEIDLFGGQRRAVEAAKASAQAAAADVADAQLTLTGDVADAYVNLRERQRRIVLNDRSVAMQARMLALVNERYARGTASRLDVARLRQQLDDTRADATPLTAERDSYLDALATLTGDAPGTLDRTLAPIAAIPLPPARVAVGDPAALVARRPDIRAAERTLAARTAKIGQAEAARFPTIKFMGIIGLGGTDPADLVKTSDVSALLAPQLSWSFLDFGRNRARIADANAARDEAEAQYRQTVLAALRDAENALSRFGARRATMATLARARASAIEAARLSEQRERAGTATTIDTLDALRQQVSAEQALSQTEAALTGDYIAIQKALGLGWASP